MLHLEPKVSYTRISDIKWSRLYFRLSFTNQLVRVFKGRSLTRMYTLAQYYKKKLYNALIVKYFKASVRFSYLICN